MESKDPNELVPVTFRISPENRERMERLAKENVRTTSYLARLAVQEFIQLHTGTAHEPIAQKPDERVPTSFRMSPKSRESLRRVAIENNCTSADLIRLAVEELIESRKAQASSE